MDIVDLPDTVQSTGKRHFPWLSNRPCEPKNKLPGRRYIDHGHCDWLDYRPHPRNLQPIHFEAGPDWRSVLRRMHMPAETCRPPRTYTVEYAWTRQPTKRCDFSTSCTLGLSEEDAANNTAVKEEDGHSTSDWIWMVDRRNGIPVTSPGDKSYRIPESSPLFHRLGSTRPVVNFGGNTPQFDTFIPVVRRTESVARESYTEREAERRRREEADEVAALEEWLPAPPLICPVVPKRTSIYMSRAPALVKRSQK